jgi:hypothetical protein
MNNRLINTKAAGGGCTDIVDNYDPFGGNGVALYQLNGNANDVSGNYNGTATSVTYGTGVFGQAGVFNGSSSYIENTNIPNEICKGYYTVNVWAYIPSSLPFRSVVHFQDDNNGHLPVLNIAANNSNWYVDIRSNSSSILTSTNIPITFNSWNMITVILYSGGAKFYLNGSEVASASFTPVFTTNTSCKFSLGRTNQGWISSVSNYLDGSIDQVRIFNTALDPLEVEALYTEELCICGGTVDTLDILEDSSCIALYPLDGNANDLSGNYSGTPTNVSYGVGEFDLAGVFNGSSSRVYASNIILPTTVSISLWVKPSNITENSYIFSGQTSGYRREYPTLIWFPANATYNGFAVAFSDSGYIASPSVATANVWHHVVAIKNSNGSGSLYVNNTLIGTKAAGTTYTPIAGFNFGCIYEPEDAGALGFFKGQIDQVRIFNKALTGGEVTTLYNETACGYTFPPFDLRSYGYNSAEDYNYSAISPYAIGLFFKPDGTKVFWTQSDTNKIEQISLSTAWDVSTATAGTSKTASGNGNCRGAWINNDGTKYYHTTAADGKIFEYTLSTAYDTFTATNTYTYTHGNGTGDAAVCFNYEGTKMYINISGVIYQYTLSTAWSTATASYSSKSLSMGVTGSEQSWDIYITEDGTKFFNVIQAANQRLDEYDLSTPYDISTGSKVRSFDYTPYGENSLGFHFKPDGSKLFIAMYGTNDVIKTFDLR